MSAASPSGRIMHLSEHVRLHCNFLLDTFEAVVACQASLLDVQGTMAAAISMGGLDHYHFLLHAFVRSGAATVRS